MKGLESKTSGVAEVTQFVQPREEFEGSPHCGIQLSHEGNEGQALIPSPR